MKEILTLVNSEIKSLKADLKYYKKKYSEFYRDNDVLRAKNTELEMNLNAANAIIEELREQLNNK